MNAENIYTNEVLAIALNTKNSQQDTYRPTWHFSPPFGLLNDPNGLAYFENQYHLFYQWNPKACTHGAKAWGHATSTNLIDWQHQPLALAPTEYFETHGCYSGSGLVVNEALELFYTGNVKYPDGTRTAYQCRATKKVGKQVEKQGIVLPLPEGYSGHVRDPKVWQHENAFYMVLGAEDLNYQGKVLLYRSDDLNKWQFLTELFKAQQSNTQPDFMLECPDFFELENQHVLITCPKNWQETPNGKVETFDVNYHLGNFDYDSLRFDYHQTAQLDFGFDFYAPQTFKDNQGRRILFAWMGKPDEFESYQPSIKYGWIHQMSCPRELYIKDGLLMQKPAQELTALRQNKESILTEEAIFENTASSELLIENIVAELDIQIAQDLKLAVTKNSFMTCRQNLKTQEWESKVWHGKVYKLQILKDSSSVEVFINDGIAVASSRFFGKNDIITIKSSNEQNISYWQLYHSR